MKNYYFVVSIGECGRYIAYTIKATTSDNLLCKFKEGTNGLTLLHVNICDTRKRAEEIAREWNQAYKNNGTYWGC